MEAVARGETVTVTSRGKVAAVMVLPEATRPRMKVRDHPAFGMWKDREDMRDPSAWVREQRRKRRHAL
jgi:antitoxin (DNA-binding transcriptional repressor) of toxin-antitoxin stability system